MIHVLTMRRFCVMACEIAVMGKNVLLFDSRNQIRGALLSMARHKRFKASTCLTSSFSWPPSYTCCDL